MKKRQKVLFEKILVKEQPDNRPPYIKCYNNGGLQVLDEIGIKCLGKGHALSVFSIAKVGKNPVVKPDLSLSVKEIVDKTVDDTKSMHRKVVKWQYVGDLWWCRKPSKKVGYEFARYKAFGGGVDLGVWDEVNYGVKNDKVVVFDSNGNRGFVIGHSQWGLTVRWDNGSVPSINIDMGKLRFEYEDDYKKYMDMFTKIKMPRRKYGV